ncbi:UDP-glycosyltransferase UGT4-like isoform X3 [Musca autumnalis]|uniref:UDP-glycosyltransferase UGT4-like isoform X3 n=1 Tax=Musca autumnalis TaxID=221902 RepID=UPI003CF084CA
MKRKVNIISILFVLLVIAVIPNESARILSVFPSPSLSHLFIHFSVAETLAKDGHNVTVIATAPNPYKNPDIKYIYLKEPMFDAEFARKMVNKPSPIYVKLAHHFGLVLDMTNNTLNNPLMQQFLRDHKAGDFDLVLLGYGMNDFIFGLGAHFQCPMVLSFMVQSVFTTNSMVGNPAEAAYVPILFAEQKQPMDFPARVKNFLSSLYENVIFKEILSRKSQRYYRYNFPADRYPPLEEVYKNVSLVLTNHHFSQGPIRPNVPALIEIGGIQIKEKPDPLPQDIAEIMDNAKNGVIYFSLGTNVQGSNLSPDKAKMIFNVLSQLPYTVLMKWGDKDFPGQANNIIYKSWLPQDDILAHPKVKLFITHGGQGSVVESQYHGVPMVGIPFFGDQHSNMANVRNSGFGLSLKYATLTEEDLRETVLEVLNNPKYRENVQQFSKLYRDRPMTPRQLVRYWVDYVIRHNGAKHMQSPAVHMTWWELQSLDVIGFLLLVVFVVVGAIVGLCKLLCCKGKKQAVNLKKKNK